MAKDLLLYYKPTCPFCVKVLRFMEKEGIDIPTANIQDKENLDKLIEIAGKKQVPCLIIDGKPMHESDDIIEYLRESA